MGLLRWPLISWWITYFQCDLCMLLILFWLWNLNCFMFRHSSIEVVYTNKEYDSESSISSCMKAGLQEKSRLAWAFCTLSSLKKEGILIVQSNEKVLHCANSKNCDCPLPMTKLQCCSLQVIFSTTSTLFLKKLPEELPIILIKKKF